MRRAAALSALGLLAFASLATAQVIDRTRIEVFGAAADTDHRPANLTDADRATFWRGKAGIAQGDAEVIAFRFDQPYVISRIVFVNDAQNRYALGSLEIQVSQDSTNGQDGGWTTVDTVEDGFSPPGGDFERVLAIGATRWIRLRLTNRGRGLAEGAFSLSEVIFNGAPAGAETVRLHTDVVVTATRREQRIIDAPVSMTVIDRRQIESSPAGNTADLLRGVPGLNVVEVSARDVSVTGRQATSAFAQGQLVLVDGRSIVNDPNGIAFFDMMPVRFDELEQVEVLHGPGSSVWGGDALTAVVNFRTRRPRDMKGGLLAVTFGEVDTRGITGRWAGANDAWSYKFSGSYYEQGAWARPTTLPDGSPMPVDFAYDNPSTRQPRFDARIDWDRDDNRRWSFRTGYARTSGSLLTPNLPLEFSFLYSFSADANYASPGMDASVQYRRLVGAALSLLDGQPSNAVSDTPAADITFRRVIGTRQALVFGGSARDDFFDIAAAPNQSSRFQGGAFVDDQIILSPKVRTHLGARVDYIQTVGAAVSPRVSLVVQPAPSSAIRFAYSRAYRPPTLIENYLFVPFSIDIDLGLGQPFALASLSAGNEDLRVARSDGFEVGYTGMLARAHTLSATVYHLVVKDEIQFGTSVFYGPEDPPPGWPLPAATVPEAALPKTFSFQNVGTLRSRGVEMALDNDWSDHVWTRLSYTWQDEPRLTDALAQFPTSVNLPPTHQMSLLVGGARGAWRGSFGATYVDRAFWSDALDPRFWGFTKDYFLVNLSVARTIPRAHSEVVLNVTNLLNKKVQQHAFGDIIRRRAVVEYRLRF